MKYFVDVNGTEHEVDLTERLGELLIEVDGEPLQLTYDEADTLGQVVLLSGGRSYAVSIEGDEKAVGITLAGHYYGMEIEDERERAAHAAEREASRHGGRVKAIMPGVVVELLVSSGEEVEQDQPLLILEAMKMQNEIAAPIAGRVKEIHVAEGAAVSAGAPLMTVEAESEAESEAGAGAGAGTEVGEGEA